MDIVPMLWWCIHFYFVKLIMTNQTRDSVLFRENQHKNSINIKQCYIDWAGDILAWLMFSQIMYWNLPAKKWDKITKLRVKREWELRLAKKDNEWYEEIRMTVAQAKRARWILVKRWLIQCATMKFAWVPTTHIKVNWNKVALYMDSSYIANPLGIYSESYTETTTEITNTKEYNNPFSEEKKGDKDKNIISSSTTSNNIESNTYPKHNVEERKEKSSVKKEKKVSEQNKIRNDKEKSAINILRNERNIDYNKLKTNNYPSKTVLILDFIDALCYKLNIEEEYTSDTINVFGNLIYWQWFDDVEYVFDHSYTDNVESMYDLLQQNKRFNDFE